MILLVDTLSLLFRSYYAIPNLETKSGKKTGALFGLVSSLISSIKEYNPNHIIACFDSAQKTLRAEIDSEYKANRDLPEDDLIEQINKSKSLLESLSIKVVENPGHEADDIIGSFSKLLSNEDIVILSGDGDLLQLTQYDNVKVFLLQGGVKNFNLYDKKSVEKKFGFAPQYIPDYKGLVGDASDNIKGVKGIGPKTATELIKKFKTIERIYEEIDKENILKDFTPRTTKLLVEGKNSAFKSKDLATIHTDLKLTIPCSGKKNWMDIISITQVNKLFRELEFNSLWLRMKEIIGEEEKKPVKVDEQLLKNTAVALWVLNSNYIDSDLDTILFFTKAETLEEANKYIIDELKKEKLFDFFEKFEKKLIVILEKMEEIGIKIDIKKMNQLAKKFNEELKIIESKAYKIVGKEFNLSSPKQVGNVLFDEIGLKPKGSKRSTKEEILSEMQNEHEIVPLILRHRTLRKLTTSYAETFPTLVDKLDRLHTSFVQTGTTTGRLSSRNPNLQNVPTNTEDGMKIRKCFISEKDYKIVSFDYSQIELRIAAILSGDKYLLKVFEEGGDIHNRVASHMFQVEKKDITPIQRRSAKAINFGILYGMGVQSLKKSLGVNQKDAQIFLDRYKKNFSQLIDYLEGVKKFVRENGYIETYYKRRRYIRDINSSLPFVRAQAERMAINAPIQGTDADIVKMGMINVDLLKKEEKWGDDVEMLLQIHDEILFEIKEEKLKEVIPKIKKVMETSIKIGNNEMSFPVEISIGDSWGTLEKIKV